MKEKEIKELFDNLDCEDTEKLLDGIDATGFAEDNVEKKLDYSKIEKMVFEKAGLNKQSGETTVTEEKKEQEQKEHKAEIIRWKKYSAFAAVACFGFMIGILTMVAGSYFRGNSDVNKNGGAQIAESENASQNEDENSGNYWTEEITEEDIEEDTEDDKKDKDGKKGKDDKKDKDDKDDKKDHSHYSDIKTGDSDEDKYTNMPSDDVDKLIEDSTSEIDMESFILKYKNVDAMIEDSDCVIRGVKEESVLYATEDETAYDLVAKFTVDSVLVDNLGDIKDSIYVNEGIKYYAEEEKIVHVGGYENMKCGKEYILFLKKTSTKRYRIAGLIYGKVPVDKNEEAIEVDSSYSDNEYVVEVKNIISEARDLYVNMGISDETEDENSNKPKDARATATPEAAPEKVPEVTATPLP